MKKGLTEVVFILDRSGSMHGLEADTIGGFNSFIEEQKKEEGECIVTTVLFNHKAVLAHDRVPLEKIENMTEADYKTGGNTALLDAVGRAIHHFVVLYKNSPKEEVPEKTIVVITTDGHENSSILYSYSEIKKMIEHEQNKYGWEFIFLGANIDAEAEAALLGIREDRSVTFCCDSVGVRINNATITRAVSQLRRGEMLDENWKAEIREYNDRGNWR